ncbi:MAG: N-acyl-D-amino-acid deacylase family protein [Oceanococcus sp.]
MPSEPAAWDVLVRGAKLFDGSGELPQFVDLAVRDGRVAAIAAHLDPNLATTVVEAEGQWLMPGLLDIHTHLDLEVELDPALPEVVRHGTTTVVMSNCSLGLAFGAQRRNGEDPIVDCFARVENVPKSVLSKVADTVDWHDSQAYLEHFAALPLGPNVVPLIPHSMLRIEVMGLQGSISREPSEAELKQMEALVEKGMQQGYAGFSTDALPFHYLANDPNRLRRIPTQFGSYSELKRLTNVVRKHGRVWQATPPKDSRIGTLRNFLLSSGRLFGKPLKVTAVAALDVVSNRSILKMGLLLTKIINSRFLQGHFRLQALAAPFKVYADGLITPLAEEILAMRQLNEPDLEDREARMALLNDPQWRKSFKRMWQRGKRGFSIHRLKRAMKILDDTLTCDLADMVMTERPVAAWKDETLAQVYERFVAWRGQGDARDQAEAQVFSRLAFTVEDDADFLLALLQLFDTDLRWYVLAANADPAVYKKALTHPKTLPGFNDSGAHLTNMAFYDANLRGLQLLMGDGDAALATHIRRLTYEPAQFFGLDVGLLEVGARADFIVLNPRALRAYESERKTRLEYRKVFEFEQMVNRSDGVVSGVWICGQRVWNGQDFAEALGKVRLGQVLLATTKGDPDSLQSMSAAA